MTGKPRTLRFPMFLVLRDFGVSGVAIRELSPEHDWLFDRDRLIDELAGGQECDHPDQCLQVLELRADGSWSDVTAAIKEAATEAYDAKVEAGRIQSPYRRRVA
jgi:hypothetical protein